MSNTDLDIDLKDINQKDSKFEECKLNLLNSYFLIKFFVFIKR